MNSAFSLGILSLSLGTWLGGFAVACDGDRPPNAHLEGMRLEKQEGSIPKNKTYSHASAKSEVEYDGQETVPDFTEIMKLLSTDAAIDSNEALKAYAIRNQLPVTFIAPKRLRTFIETPEVERIQVSQLGFRWAPERISVTWSGNIFILGNQAEASKVLLNAVNRAGLANPAAKLTSHLAEQYEARVRAGQQSAAEMKIKYTPPTGWWTFTRKNGRTVEELLISDFSQGDGGMRVACGGTFQWCVTCAYAGKEPTLHELLKTMPVIRPRHREDALFDRLQHEPAFAFSTDLLQVRYNSGWKIITAAKAQDEILKSLKAAGFSPRRTTKLPGYEHGAAEQQQWERSTDWTHASIISFNEKNERIGVTCQSPQKPPEKSK
jgi:hypothetical protein